MLLGLPSLTLLAVNDNPQALRTTAFNLFAQHDWRLTSSLTVNTGLRYELNQPPVDAADRMRIFDLATETLVPVGENGVPAVRREHGLQQPGAARRRELEAARRAPT